MWELYRVWKNRVGFPLVVLALLLMNAGAEFSPQWYAGMGITLCLVAAYVVEEIIWMAKRQGRPCGRCGQKVRLKSFSVQAICPHCSLPLD
jgi:hypothetical protein